MEHEPRTFRIGPKRLNETEIGMNARGRNVRNGP